MQQKEPKLLDGILSRSKRKYDLDPTTGRYVKRADANPKAPDYYGTFKIAIPGGEEPFRVYVGAWIRKGQDGSSFLSVSGDADRDEHRTLSIGGIALPQAAAERPHVQAVPPVPEDEDLPF